MSNNATPAPRSESQQLLDANLRVIWNPYTIFFGLMLIYAVIAKHFGALGGLSLEYRGWEALFVMYLFVYFYHVQRPTRWRGFLAAAPIFLAYLGQDIYYLFYGKVFRIVELTEVPELIDILPLRFIFLIVLALLPLLAFVYLIDIRNRFATLLIGCIPLALLVTNVEANPKTYTTLYEQVGEEIVAWSDAQNVDVNGYFAMLLYREAERNLSLHTTSTFYNRSKYDEQAKQQAAWLGEHGNQKNVHLIVMESLLDPTLFTKVKFTDNPVHPSFSKLFGNKLGLSISPVFGGGTAQAEFEVLCAVPAFRELAGMEFSMFTGAPAYCMPGLLDLAGYQTIASNAFKPNFFNAIPAYKGIGFKEIYFPKEYVVNGDTYLSTGDVTGEDFMFDGELLSQNLAFIAKQLHAENKRPIFNYVLSMYGHMPHVLNEDKRPMRFSFKGKKIDGFLERSANQYYYRTQAIASYINELMKIDKNSIIVVVSDHVPPLEQGPQSYARMGYLDNRENSYYHNRLMIIENGKVKRYAKIHHYDIEKIVFNYLSNGQYCREHACAFAKGKFEPDREAMRDKYLTVMAHAME